MTLPDSWNLNLTAHEQSEASHYLSAFKADERVIAVSMGTKISSKDWTEPNWRSFLEKLDSQKWVSGVVAIGAGDEFDLTERILMPWRGRKLNLCGKVSPRLSAAILSQTDLFIGHDSGPMHLAACVGTPCIAIFSAQNPPGQWFPFGSNHTVLYHQTECFGCRLTDCLIEKKRCILSIGVDEVLNAVERSFNSLKKNIS